AERFRDLHRVGADATRCAVNEDTLALLELALVAYRLERRRRGDTQRSRLFEAHIPGLRHDRAIGLHRDVLGARPGPSPEDVVTGAEPSDLATHRLDDARVVDADPGLLRPTEPRRAARDPRAPGQGVPVGDIDRRRAHTDEHLVRSGLGRRDLANLD